MVTVTVVSIAVVVIILQEEVLVCAVGSESDRGDTEAGEETSEALGSAEGAAVAPGLIASPWIPLGPNGRWGGRGLVLGEVETGGVTGGHCESCPVVNITERRK